ncbi:YdgH/BhsA/McbA-like domain containing protein [Citrobacter sp. JGM124]|uniref:YdgH/BhsA/McbA-like domain containing protein n=1 Tax=Citrobacter sp. JGM124 TaxID=2799789 RepID=UPI001BA75764|nr:YdgH/BhsA/McbA-like domain containing protein [Citrobacter sp. JGM124]MBS0849161.1 DUF1471 domain-containing protein [Citrobacter sp. JGM124]
MQQSNALTTLLASMGLLPSLAQSAEDVAADCVTGLNEIGTISVNDMVGSPVEVEKVIALKASEQGASYYRIIQLQEDLPTERWQAQVIIYA